MTYLEVNALINELGFEVVGRGENHRLDWWKVKVEDKATLVVAHERGENKYDSMRVGFTSISLEWLTINPEAFKDLMRAAIENAASELVAN